MIWCNTLVEDSATDEKLKCVQSCRVVMVRRFNVLVAVRSQTRLISSHRVMQTAASRKSSRAQLLPVSSTKEVAGHVVDRHGWTRGRPQQKITFHSFVASDLVRTQPRDSYVRYVSLAPLLLSAVSLKQEVAPAQPL